jgi:hypothetical protein
MKFDTKWQAAWSSVGIVNMGMMDAVGDLLDPGNTGDIWLSSESVGEVGILPIFWARAFLFAFLARRSVACVSFRKTRSNSSL